jgi:antirestriction protein ArdC
MLTRKNAYSQALDNTYGYTHLNSAEADQMKVEEVITHRIVKLLEAGTVPWHKPWAKRHTGSDAFPRNATTKRHYRGINVFILASQSYGSPYWLTS